MTNWVAGTGRDWTGQEGKKGTIEGWFLIEEIAGREWQRKTEGFEWRSAEGEEIEKEE